MNELYMSVDIIRYGNGDIICCFNESIGDAPVETKFINLEKAYKLMWELVLAGGKRSYHTNYLDHSITSSNVYIFLPL